MLICVILSLSNLLLNYFTVVIAIYSRKEDNLFPDCRRKHRDWLPTSLVVLPPELWAATALTNYQVEFQDIQEVCFTGWHRNRIKTHHWVVCIRVWFLLAWWAPPLAGWCFKDSSFFCWQTFNPLIVQQMSTPIQMTSIMPPFRHIPSIKKTSARVQSAEMQANRIRTKKTSKVKQ